MNNNARYQFLLNELQYLLICIYNSYQSYYLINLNLPKNLTVIKILIKTLKGIFQVQCPPYFH